MVRKATLFMAVAALICWAAYATIQEFDLSWGEKSPFEAWAEADEKPGFAHYRIKASYTHLETGEPIIIDYVVSCNAEVTNWSYTDPSVVRSAGPRFVVRPLPNGEAMAFFTVGGCDSLVRRKDTLPPDGSFFPLIITYDDIEDLSFGLGYSTEDAYDSPLAKVAFNGATAKLTDEAAWRAWRARAKEDVATAIDHLQAHGRLPKSVGDRGTYPQTAVPLLVEVGGGSGIGFGTGRGVGSSCWGYSRLKAPQWLVDEFFTLAPPEFQDKRFWSPMHEEQDHASAKISKRLLSLSKEPIFEDGKPWRRFRVLNYRGGRGLVNREGTGFTQYITSNTRPDVYHMMEQYPLLPRSETTKPNPTTPQDVYPRRVPLTEEYKGFLACGKSRPLDILSMWKEPNHSHTIDLDYGDKLHPLYVNDHLVAPTTNPNRQPAFIIDRTGYIMAQYVWGGA